MLISTGVQHGTIFAPQPFGLPLGETTTPQYLKSLGYTARGVGKVCSSALFTSLNFTRPLLLHISERDPFQLRSVPTTHSSLVSVTSFPRVFYAMWKTTFVVHSIFFVGSIEIDFFFMFQWHLGFFEKEYTPTFRGFDSFYGYWTGKTDYWTHRSFEDYWGLDLRDNMEVHCSSFKL